MRIRSRRTTNPALFGLLIYSLAGVALMPTASLSQGPWGPSGVKADSGPADTAALGCDLRMGLSSGRPILEPGRMGYKATVSRVGCAQADTSLGGTDFDEVMVENILPAGLTFVSTVGCAEDPIGVPICTLGTVDGAEATYIINVVVHVVDPSGNLINKIINSVSLESSDPPDTNPANNIATIALYRPLFADGFESGDTSAWIPTRQFCVDAQDCSF